jgi:hypothetical protein
MGEMSRMLRKIPTRKRNVSTPREYGFFTHSYQALHSSDKTVHSIFMNAVKLFHCTSLLCPDLWMYQPMGIVIATPYQQQ